MVPIRGAGHGRVNKAVANGLYRLATRAGVGSQPTKRRSSDQSEQLEQQPVQSAGGGESGESGVLALGAETLPVALSEARHLELAPATAFLTLRSTLWCRKETRPLTHAPSTFSRQ